MKKISGVVLLILCAVMITSAFAGCTKSWEGVSTSLTEKNWTEAIEGLNSTSATMDIITDDGRGEGKHESVFMIDGEKMYSTLVNPYYVEKSGEQYFSYSKGTDDVWTKSNAPKYEYESINMLAFIHSIVKDMKFDDFVVVGESYEMKSDKLSSVVLVQGLSKFSISFSKAKKVKAILYEVSASPSLPTMSAQYAIKNYGKTKVTLPKVA